MAHVTFEGAYPPENVIPKGILHLKETFHILLGHTFSCTVSKSNKGINVGIFKTDNSGRRRGITLPYHIWHRLVLCHELIYEATQLVDISCVDHSVYLQTFHGQDENPCQGTHNRE